MESSTGQSSGVVPSAISDRVERQLSSRSFELPLLPRVASRVMSLCSMPDTDAAELSGVLHQDQAFASHILRVANSPSMGAGVQILSLQQAISRLGMVRVGEIAVAISVKGKVFRAPGHANLVRDLWRHSLATASYAKEIARARRSNVENAFLCGLLHDVGKPLILDSICELELSAETFADASVRIAMNHYHAEVGVLLSEEWGLPDQVSEAIRYHHDYSAAPSHRVAAMIVSLADMFAHIAVPSGVPVEEAEVRGLPVVEELNLYVDDMDALFAQSAAVAELVEVIA